MLGIKEKLKCKPFSYYFERVAPDMLERYPLIDPPNFAHGAVSNSSIINQDNIRTSFQIRFKVWLMKNYVLILWE